MFHYGTGSRTWRPGFLAVVLALAIALLLIADAADGGL